MEGKRKDNIDKTFFKDVWKVREKIIYIKLSLRTHGKEEKGKYDTTFLKDIWKVKERKIMIKLF